MSLLSLGDLHKPGIEPGSHSFQADPLPIETPGNTPRNRTPCQIVPEALLVGDEGKGSFLGEPEAYEEVSIAIGSVATGPKLIRHPFTSSCICSL